MPSFQLVKHWIRKRPVVRALSNASTRKSIFETGIIFAVAYAALYAVGLFIPAGFDWEHGFDFGRGVLSPIWTPWTNVVIRFLNMPSIFAFTLLAIAWRVFRYKPGFLPLFFSIVSLPTFWLLHLGNLDGIVLMGLLLLPWGVPLVLMKPQIASFALLANRRSFIAGAIWVAVSLLIYGFWPVNLMGVSRPDWHAEWVQDISLFPWGLLIALPLLWVSRGDEDMLMAAGSFGTPHLFPYHFVVLLPSMARMSRRWMVLCWLSSWSPLLANWLGEEGWHLGLLIPLCFWIGLYLARYRERKAVATNGIDSHGDSV